MKSLAASIALTLDGRGGGSERVILVRLAPVGEEVLDAGDSLLKLAEQLVEAVDAVGQDSQGGVHYLRSSRTSSRRWRREMPAIVLLGEIRQRFRTRVAFTRPIFGIAMRRS